MVSGALLGFKGAFPYWQTFAACFLGMWVSDIGIYLIMKLGGRRVLESRWAQRLLPLHKTDRASRWFDRYGGFALIFSRLVLGTRTALLIVSGLLKYPTIKFLIVSSTGAIGWLLLVFSLFGFLGQSATVHFRCTMDDRADRCAKRQRGCAGGPRRRKSRKGLPATLRADRST